MVDCGGGLGIAYRDEPAPLPAAFAGAMRGAFHNLDVRVAVEPGRWLVGPAGVLLASVVLAKRAGGSRFVVLDAAMNDLIRPAMYDAWHGIVPLSAMDAVAPVAAGRCRRADLRNRRHVRARPHAAAAGAGRACGDPGRRRLWFGDEFQPTTRARCAAEVMVDGSDWSVIRPRPSHADLWRDELIPHWLE